MSTASTRPPGPDRAGERPLGQIVASVVDGIKTLARQRAELARIDVSEAAEVRAKGGGTLAAAGLVALYAIGFIAAAGAAALAIVLPVWLAILIVGATLFLVAAVLAAVGRRVMRTASKPGQRTIDTLREDVRWAKQRIGS